MFLAPIIATILGCTDMATIFSFTDMTPIERAIWQVESSQHPGGVPFYGDGGAAAGPFQIHKGYWIDSGIGGKYPQDLFDLKTSVRCFRGFMGRYAVPHRIPDGMSLYEAMARMHVGGPKALYATGKKKEHCDKYWENVQEALKKGQGDM